MSMTLMRNTLLSIVAVVLVSASGCGKSDSSPEVVAGASSATASPADVVAEFLEAVRVGNSESASTRLTPLALQRIKENDMGFAPPASETAKFTVSGFELFEEDKAFVDSVWTELDGDGKSFDEPMTWGLKLTDAGWRISGMAAHMGPNQPPILVDFENPGQEMSAPANMAQSQKDENSRQARQPAQDPFNQTSTR